MDISLPDERCEVRTDEVGLSAEIPSMAYVRVHMSCALDIGHVTADTISSCFRQRIDIILRRLDYPTYISSSQLKLDYLPVWRTKSYEASINPKSAPRRRSLTQRHGGDQRA